MKNDIQQSNKMKAAKNSIKTLTDIAISNGMPFTVQVVPLDDSVIGFPACEEVYSNMTDYVRHDMAYKALNERALEGMRKKWEQTNPGTPFVPKKQASELLVALIAPSAQYIHLFYSIPSSMTYSPVPTREADEVYDLEARKMCYYKLSPPEGLTVFKYRDLLLQQILDSLKTQGIYQVEEDDDDGPAGNFNDL